MSPSPPTANSIKALIELELAAYGDARAVEQVRSLLVEPEIELRPWDYGEPGQRFPCWIVLRGSTTGIAYCEHGFGPSQPWGLVWIDGNGTPTMGADFCWYSTFMEIVETEFLTDPHTQNLGEA